MSSAATEQTQKRPLPKRINKINSKSKEADATELDRLFACRGNCEKCSDNFAGGQDAEKRDHF